MMNIVIAEEVPSKNKGEAAILYGIAESLKGNGKRSLTIITRYDEDQIYSDAAEVVNHTFMASYQSLPSLILQAVSLVALGGLEALFGRSTARLFALSTAQIAMIGADAIIVGHDNVFAKDVNLRALPIVIYGKLTRKPLISYASSIGPFKNPNSIKVKWLINKVLKRIDLFTLRDQQSYDYAGSIGLDLNKMEVTTDIAFLLKPAEKERIDDLLGSFRIENGTALVGLTVTRLLLENISSIDGLEVQDVEERYDRALDVIAHMIDTAVERYDFKMVLIAHAIGPQERHDDRPVNEDLIKRIRHHDRVVVINDDLHTRELKGILGRLELLIGMRTHSMIGASGMGTPCVGLTTADRFKTNGIIGQQLGMDDFLVDVTALNSEELTAKVCEAWEKRAELRERIAQRRSKVLERARRNGELLNAILEEKQG